MSTSMLGCVMLLGLSAQGMASPLWMLEPVPLTDAVTDPAYDMAMASLRAALGRGAGPRDLLFGTAPIRAALDTRAGGEARASALIARAEELYINFDFIQAAAAAGEAGGSLTAALPDLDEHTTELLVRARLLEAMSWLDAGQPAAAKQAFDKLLVLRPDHVISHEELPPEGQALLDQARRELRQRGYGGVLVRSSPSGAQVFVDGRPRGQTPVSVVDLPAGVHGLRLINHGYLPQGRELRVIEGQQLTVDIAFDATPQLLAYQRVREGARAGVALAALRADLEHLREHLQASAIVLVGLGRGPGGPFVALTTWQPEMARHALVHLGAGVSATELVADLAQHLLHGPAGSVLQLPPSAALAADFERHGLGQAPGLRLVPVSPASGPWYSRWWVYVLAGVVVAGGAAGAIVAVRRGREPPVPQPDLFLIDLQF